MNYKDLTEEDKKKLELNKRKAKIIESLHEFQVLVRASNESEITQWEYKISKLNEN